MDIRNSVQLKVALGVIAEKVIENVSLKVLEYLKVNIKKYVYEYGDSNEIYHAGTGEATFEFYNSFIWKDMVKSVSLVTKELFYDYSKMDYKKETWLHGSDPAKVKEQGGDARKFLAEILNVEGHTSKLFISKKRRPYWDITIEELFDGKEMDKMFDAEFRKAGFKKI